MIPYVIIILGVIAWLLPPLKQRGTQYFFYFILLAITDPVRLVFFYLHWIGPMQIAVVMEFLCIFALIKKKNLEHIVVLLVTVIYLLVYKSLSIQEIRIFGIILQSIILLIIIYKFLRYIEETKALNLFYMILIFYQITLVSKFIAIIIDINFGVVQFYLTSLLEVVFACLFVFINVDTKNFRLFKEIEEV